MQDGSEGALFSNLENPGDECRGKLGAEGCGWGLGLGVRGGLQKVLEREFLGSQFSLSGIFKKKVFDVKQPSFPAK